jgi:hypothetical protein
MQAQQVGDLSGRAVLIKGEFDTILLEGEIP